MQTPSNQSFDQPLSKATSNTLAEVSLWPTAYVSAVSPEPLAVYICYNGSFAYAIMAHLHML